PDGDLDEWADQMIQDCGRLGEAELVLAHAESGFLQLQQTEERTFDAWVATRQMPTEWREREDFAWWTAALTRRVAPELDGLLAAGPEVRRRLALLPHGATPADLATTDPAVDEHYRRLGSLHARRMANQASYPPNAAIGGVAFQLYLDVLGLLIAWMLKHLDRGAEPGDPRSDAAVARPGLASPPSRERHPESIA